MDKRRIAGIVVAVLLAAAFGVSKRRHRVTPPPPATDEAMVLGSVRLARCPADQQRASGATYCTTFEVPERWDQPDGRKLSLRVEVVRADAQVAERDLVVLLAGGPGQAATESFDPIAGAFDPLLKHRHVLLVDQRGTGHSQPLKCKKDDEEDAHGVDLERAKAHTRACLAEVEKTADPRWFSTTDAVQDLEALRQALGAPLYDLVGISYGTRVAQQYLAHHPDGVRSVVLDGVVPNAIALGQTTAADLESALKRQLAKCTADAGCKKRFGDPYETLKRVRASLRAHPQQVTFRDPTTFTLRTKTIGELAFIGLVRLFSYSTETSALLPLLIDEAAHDRFAELMAQVALIDAQLEGMVEGMGLSVLCTEDVDLLTSRPEDAQLLLGESLVPAKKAQCDVWPHGTRPADFHEPVRSDKPVLLLSGELDPVTPPANADAVLATLSNARALVAKGHGHNALVRGCMPLLVAKMVDELQPKKLDATCLDVLGPMPAFTSFDGASP